LHITGTDSPRIPSRRKNGKAFLSFIKVKMLSPGGKDRGGGTLGHQVHFVVLELLHRLSCRICSSSALKIGGMRPSEQ